MRNFFVPLLYVLVIGCLSVPGGVRASGELDREFQECSDCPRMVAIPGGQFRMGSPNGEPGRLDIEGPEHPVSVRAFAIGKFEVTVAEFLAFLRKTEYQPEPCDPILGFVWKSPGRGYAEPPSVMEVPLQPADCLNWNDAQAYIAWLNDSVRKKAASSPQHDGPYRLPSEAEWEYAARAGTTTARWWGDAIGKGSANCNGCGSEWDDKLIAPVGSFGPNAFGLYDMLGNLWQWVADCWNDSYVGAPGDGSAWTVGDCTKRVIRGGSWSSLPVLVRSASRGRADASGKGFDYSGYAGFRVARTLP